jgi:hypothetical protein
VARGRKPLTPDQSSKLRHVADSDDAWRRAKKYEYERARQQAEERIAQYAYVRDQAVFDAVQSGIPKTIVGRDGLGTSNPYAVNEAYERVSKVQQDTGVVIPAKPKDRFKWGTILAVDERWLFGWVLDAEDPTLTTASLVGDMESDYGYFVGVDRQNETTTSLVTRNGVLTTADEGWEDVREWAAIHAGDADGGGA